jgi:hypothetical protein
MGEAEERTLRAKYWDWCSARVAERFLDLSPEEIYALAWPSAGAAGGFPASGTEAGGESYRVLVQRATEALLGQMSLPSYEAWRLEYELEPGRFEAEMLGFWRDVRSGD